MLILIRLVIINLEHNSRKEEKYILVFKENKSVWYENKFWNRIDFIQSF